MTAAPRTAYQYQRHKDQDGQAHHPVVICGGGMVGLCLAVDLAQRGIVPVVLERGASVSEGSRSICQAKRTLEIWDRLGVGERMRDAGVTWKIGKLFHGHDLVYQFDLLPEAGHKMPAFVNLQQYTVEEILIERLKELGGSVRWCSKLESFEDHGDHVALRIETPDGPYAMSTDWLIACDGAKSHVRRSMGLSFEGQVFQDRFLIVDAKMDVERPLERWFWFEPPFHEGQTVLLHRQPGDVWRVDFQLSGDIDEAAEKDPERIRARLAAMFGEDVSFDLEWVSIYAFQCRTLERYVHNRIVFCGDSAHQVSPFGARGGNGGTQDADNLGWKLAAILKGEAPEGLLETYQMERKQAALENIGHSTRATDFMTPKSHASRIIRDEVLDMAKAYGFAKALINSGRLSRPCSLTDSPLSTPDDPAFEGGLPPGSPAADAPIRVSGKEAWFLEQLQGQFTLVHWGSHASAPDVSASPLPMRVLCVGSGEDIEDTDGLLAKRYGAHDGTAYLFRPDQHVAARWREAAGADVPGSVRLALGYSLQLGEQSLKAAA